MRRAGRERKLLTIFVRILAVDDVDAQALIDWYAANPAEALACKMGEMKFRRCGRGRSNVGGALRPSRISFARFCKDGAMPLDILEAKMKGWMDGFEMTALPGNNRLAAI